MTTAESVSRDQRQLNKILSVVSTDPVLRSHVATLQVSIENTTVALRGELPNAQAKTALFLAVRQAGVLDQISDYVRVSGSISKTA